MNETLQRLNDAEKHIEAFNIAHDLIDNSPQKAYALLSYVQYLVEKKTLSLEDVRQILITSSVDPI